MNNKAGRTWAMLKNKRKKDRKSGIKFRKKLASALELPEEALGETPCLSLRGSLMTLWNCGEVLCYEDGRVRLTLLGSGGKVFIADVWGEGLYMRSFLDGAVTVEGTIARFELCSA